MRMRMPMPIVKGFRRFHSNTLLLSRQVVTEISKLEPGSNVEQSGSSSATPFTSNRTIRKKVCIADRRAMLESFVNKYRATNLGKFPSPTSAQKEVGGSYYLIRKMIQEMEYDFKISSGEKGLVKGNKKQTKSEDTISREIAIKSLGSQEGSSSHISIGQQLCEDPWLESVGNSDTKLELKDGLQPSTSSRDTGNSNITRDDTHNIATESHDRGGQFHEKLEQKPNDESSSEDNFAFDKSESNVEKQHDGIRNTMRDMPEQQRDDEVREKPSIWGNLKSLANVFFNIWK